MDGSRRRRGRRVRDDFGSRGARRGRVADAADDASFRRYDGTAYSGFAAQNAEGSDVDTVERRFFDALEKTCLVAGRDDCGYSRCGRTDKGVSAVGQVVGLRVRSAARAGEEIAAHPGDAPGGRAELDYCGMLNRVLPADVRALAWSPVKPGFSARFSCASRTYPDGSGTLARRSSLWCLLQEDDTSMCRRRKTSSRAVFVYRRESSGRRRYRYWLARTSSTGSPRDVAAMRLAAAKYVGDHDFRNFCKMDVVRVSNFRRDVYAATLIEDGDALRFEVHGQAFLW